MEYVGGHNGERMQRLEKADVLEVTVNHLRNLKAGGRLGTTDNMSRSSSFKGGYSACAKEVASFISSPYSGVHQEQALRIAMGIADGLRNLHSGERRLEEADTENIRPAALPHSFSIADHHPQPSVKRELHQSAVVTPPPPPPLPNCPLDLSTRVNKSS